MPVASLLVALVCIAIAVGVIVFVPSHAVDTSHATQQVTPGAIDLPPTAVPPTATPAR
jgi:hypothetical protein